MEVSYSKGDSKVTVVLKAPAATVKLWWPAGVGPHPLYKVTAVLKAVSRNHSSSTGRCNNLQQGVASTERHIGFRMLALVTGNDTDPGYVAKVCKITASDSMFALPVYDLGTGSQATDRHLMRL